MLLSQYCKDIKIFIEKDLTELDNNGCVIGFNGDVYESKQDYLDGCVIEIVGHIVEEELEKDLDLATAFQEAGIVDGYLTGTSILAKVVTVAGNPLKGVFN